MLFKKKKKKVYDINKILTIGEINQCETFKEQLIGSTVVKTTCPNKPELLLEHPSIFNLLDLHYSFCKRQKYTFGPYI